jgi:ATP:ADP antiporter, AAA family
MKRIRLFFNVHSGEVEPALLMFGFFFLVTTVFQILKPLKKGLFVSHFGAERELIAKGINIDLALAAMVGFTLLYNALGGRRLVRFLCAAFLAVLLGFAATVNDRPAALVNYAFYLFGDLWSTVWVATFWAFLNEISTAEQSQRLYGWIGIGGLLGGMTGSSLVSGLVQRYSSPPLILFCAGLTGLIWVLVWRADHLAQQPGAAMRRQGFPTRLERIRWAGALEGARMVMKSRYLLAIVGVLALYEFCSQILDFQFSSVLASSISGGRDAQAYLARVYLVTNVLSLLVQVLLTNFLLQRFGPGAGLLILPVVIALSSGAFWVEPSLLMGSLLIVADNGLNYSVNQTSRETLYVPTSSDAQYKARAFTNMFVQRLAKGLAILISAAFIWAGTRWLSSVTILTSLLWISIAVFAGRRFENLADSHELTPKEKVA